MQVYKIKIPGKPGSKQSVRVGTKETLQPDGSKKKIVQCYQDKDLVALEKKYWAYALKQLREQKYKLVGKALIHVTKLYYVFPMNDNALKELSPEEREYWDKHGLIWKYTKPDLSDNLQKPLFDALSGLVYQNDCQVVAIDGLRKILARPEYVGIIMEFIVCGAVPDELFFKSILGDIKQIKKDGE